MLVTYLPASGVILALSDLGGGNLQIVASGLTFSASHRYVGVLESTTDFASWTAISTNFVQQGGVVTNIVQTTNTMSFYRIEQR
jgi:glycerate-2-kinase